MNNKPSFSKSLSSIKLSPIVSISELVRERAGKFREQHGEDFVYFQRGEIAFPTPDFIVEAAGKAITAGKTKYPKSGGEPVLKDAIIKKMERFNGATGLNHDNVLVTYGGQEALQLSFKLFEGKRGAGFGPCWSCVLENFVPYCGIDFQVLPLQEDFSVNWKELEEILKTVDFFYFNNPQNPTGKVFEEWEVRLLVRLCKEHGTYLIADEAYDMITYDGVKFFSALSLEESHVIGCYTLSKAFAMTGWRVGYMVCRDPQLIWLCRLGDYSQTAGVVTFAQYGAAEALANEAASEAALAPMMEAYAKRREHLYKLLKEIPGLKVNRPMGAFYMFPSFSAYIPESLRGKERQKFIFEKLLEKGVAVVYGRCFGEGFDDHVRISFSGTTPEQIELGVKRIRETLAGLRSAKRAA